jgi:hypothetical protein
MYGSRGCFGCFKKSKHIISVDEPAKGLKIQGRGKAVQRASCLSDDFWSSSSIFEMDNNNSAVQSQRSASSVSNSNQAIDHQSGTSTDPLEFVNHGLRLWNQTRQNWVGSKGTSKRTPVRENRISWNATYDSLLGTNKPFPKPVPLTEMISFLYDVWEQEGLYD